MTIAEALKKYSDIEADLLLGHVLKQSKEFLYLESNTKLTPRQKSTFEALAKKRRSGIPAAYILGYKYFYGLKFKVNHNVLIPRPETEWLVEQSLRMIANKLKVNPHEKLKILDVGTGSGCIAISIAANTDYKNVKVSATDISSQALQVAKKNAEVQNVTVNFSTHDLLRGVKGKFDIIIANLPYVPIDEYQKFYQNLKFEPKLALTDRSNTSEIIQAFMKQVEPRLNSGGALLLELDPTSVIYISPYKPKIVKDHNGLDRFAIFI
jgi:release factor glutamine methyltransferase